MLNILSPDVFNSSMRMTNAEVEVYFDGMDKPPTVFTHLDYLVDFKILEETNADASKPLGAVSANECTLTLLNINQIFTVTNTTSPYASKIKNELPIKIFIYAAHADPKTRIPFGTYYVTEWVCDIGSINANITCHDKLYFIGQLDTPVMPVIKDTTIGTLIEKLFILMDLKKDIDFKVDTTLTQQVYFGWFKQQKILKTLQDFSDSGFCYFYVDRTGCIIVKNAQTKSAAVTTITDNDQIISSKIPQSAFKTYCGVEVKCNIPSVTEPIQLVNLTNVTVPVGFTTLNKVKFSKNPVYYISYMEVLGGLTTKISGINYSPWDIDITLNNIGQTTETVAIAIYGCYIDLTPMSIISKNDNQQSVKLLQMEGYLIQDNDYATHLSGILYNFVNKFDAYVDMEIRGNPLLELGDTIHANDRTAHIDMDIRPYRYSYEYNGALSGSIEALNVLIL